MEKDPIETVHEWDELTTKQKDGVIAAHSGLSKDKAKLLRLFNLGRPKIVLGIREENVKDKIVEVPYCRVHQDSVDVMKVITREYL